MNEPICILRIQYSDITVTTGGGAEYRIPIQYKVGTADGDWTDYWTPEKLDKHLSTVGRRREKT